MTHAQSPATSKLYSENERDRSPHMKSAKLCLDDCKHCSAKPNSKHRRRYKLNHQKDKCDSKYTIPCMSDFVSSRRLTTKVGLFNYGKSSTVVSRLQCTASAETKARVEQDLQEILNLANNVKQPNCTKLTKEIVVNKPFSTKEADNSKRPKLCHCDHSSHNMSITVRSTATTPMSPMDNSKFSPRMHHGSDHLKLASQSDNHSVHTPITTGSVLEAMKNNIMHKKLSFDLSRLHQTVHKKKDELFPHVSLRGSLHNEIITLQRNFNLSRKICGTSTTHFQSSASSSQSHLNHLSTEKGSKNMCKASDKKKCSPASFELNFCSEFTHASPPKNNWLFSDLKGNEIFQNHEENELLDEQSKTNIDFFQQFSPCSQQSDPILSSTISPCFSPDFESSPIWRPECSPLKFPRDSPSPSWHFSRCKMY